MKGNFHDHATIYQTLQRTQNMNIHTILHDIYICVYTSNCKYVINALRDVIPSLTSMLTSSLVLLDQALLFIGEPLSWKYPKCVSLFLILSGMHSCLKSSGGNAQSKVSRLINDAFCGFKTNSNSVNFHKPKII